MNQDALSVYLSAAVTTATVTNGDRFHSGDIIEHDDEVMQVVSVSTNTLTLNRGHMGTTAADHSAGSVIDLVNVFTTPERDDAISAAFNALFPYVSEPFTKNVHAHGNRYQLDSLDVATDWSALADATTASLNTTDQQEGVGCLNLGATYNNSGAGYTKTISPAMNAGNYEYLNLWLYLDQKRNSSEEFNFDPNTFCEVRIGNNSAAYNYTYVSLDEMNEGSWTLLNLNLQDFQASGTVDTSAMDYLAIYFKDKKDIASGNLKMDEWFLTTYPIYTNKLRYRLPKNMFRVSKVEFYDQEDQSQYWLDTRWDTEGNYLTFRKYTQSMLHKPIQLYGDLRVAAPTSSTQTINLSDEKEELVTLYATNALYENLTSERTRFTRISSKVNRQDGGVLDIVRGSNLWRARFLDLMRQMQDAGKAVGIDFNQD